MEYAGFDDPQYDAQPQPSTLLSKIQNSKLLIYGTLISRLVLGGIFFVAGLSKLGDVSGFVSNINDYEMGIPAGVQTLMANVLPPLEIGIGVWILVGLFTRLAAGLAGGLMVIFLVALVQAVFRGLLINCGCVATGPQSNALGAAVVNALGPVGKFLTAEKADATSIIRDGVFLLMAVHLMLVPTVFGIDNLRRRGQTVDMEVYEDDTE